jgi:hypothetical protein
MVGKLFQYVLLGAFPALRCSPDGVTVINRLSG